LGENFTRVLKHVVHCFHIIWVLTFNYPKTINMLFELHYELIIVFSLICLQPLPNKIGTMEQKVKISHELIKPYNSSEFRGS